MPNIPKDQSSRVHSHRDIQLLTFESYVPPKDLAEARARLVAVRSEMREYMNKQQFTDGFSEGLQAIQAEERQCELDMLDQVLAEGLKQAQEYRKAAEVQAKWMNRLTVVIAISTFVYAVATVIFYWNQWKH